MEKITTFVDVTGTKMTRVSDDINVRVGERVSIWEMNTSWRGTVVEVRHDLQKGENGNIIHDKTIRVEE